MYREASELLEQVEAYKPSFPFGPAALQWYVSEMIEHGYSYIMTYEAHDKLHTILFYHLGTKNIGLATSKDYEEALIVALRNALEMEIKGGE